MLSPVSSPKPSTGCLWHGKSGWLSVDSEKYRHPSFISRHSRSCLLASCYDHPVNETTKGRTKKKKTNITCFSGIYSYVLPFLVLFEILFSINLAPCSSFPPLFHPPPLRQRLGIRNQPRVFLPQSAVRQQDHRAGGGRVQRPHLAAAAVSNILVALQKRG